MPTGRPNSSTSSSTASRHLQPFVHGKAVVAVRVVDVALPADGGARFFKIDAHDDEQLALERQPVFGLQLAGIVHGLFVVVDGAGANDDDQPVIRPCRMLAMGGGWFRPVPAPRGGGQPLCSKAGVMGRTALMRVSSMRVVSRVAGIAAAFMGGQKRSYNLVQGKEHTADCPRPFCVFRVFLGLCHKCGPGGRIGGFTNRDNGCQRYKNFCTAFVVSIANFGASIMFHSLRARLIGICVAITTVSLLALALATFFPVRDDAERSLTDQRIGQLTHLHATDLANWVREKQRITSSIQQAVGKDDRCPSCWRPSKPEILTMPTSSCPRPARLSHPMPDGCVGTHALVQGSCRR